MRWKINWIQAYLRIATQRHSFLCFLTMKRCAPSRCTRFELSVKCQWWRSIVYLAQVIIPFVFNNVTNIWSISVCYLLETQLIWVFVMCAFVKPNQCVCSVCSMFIKYLSIMFYEWIWCTFGKINNMDILRFDDYDNNVDSRTFLSSKRWTNSVFQPIDVCLSTAFRCLQVHMQINTI